MELVALGTQATYPRGDRACSGYLIKKDTSHLLLDIGTGVLNNLFKWLDPSELDGIIITHLHPDHFLDIYLLRYFLQFDKETEQPIKIFTPSVGREFISQLVTEQSLDRFLNVFSFQPITENEQLSIGQFSLRFERVNHLDPTYGVRIDEGKLVYSSDCSFDSSVVQLAKGAKTFLCEATLQGKDASTSNHLTAYQAGEVARLAGVGELLITHIWPTYNRKVSKQQAEETFGKEVTVAEENKVYEIE